ncbi:hypothetical protein GCM10010517_70940 [Streptosporangium fragile]|uniref:Uncharacterized protein n=1 Tax=Streptosporangium fragile TaxID=46186 RepID=A0ABN3W7I9_9ACTN
MAPSSPARTGGPRPSIATDDRSYLALHDLTEYTIRGIAAAGRGAGKRGMEPEFSEVVNSLE